MDDQRTETQLRGSTPGLPAAAVARPVGVGVAACGLFALGVLWFDAVTPRGVVGSLLYVVLVLFGIGLPWRSAPLVLALLGSVLTLVGIALKQPQGEMWIAWTNRSLSLGAIWVTAYLCYLEMTATQQRRRAQERVEQLQSDLYRVARRSELGEMVGAIAHEINQPLTAAHSYAAAARRSLRSDGSASVDVDTMIEKAMLQTQRAAEVIRHLRRMMRQGEAERGVEDIGDVVREAVSFAMIGAGPFDIRVSVEMPPHPVRCEMNRTQIQQVLLNLVRNAIEAMQLSQRRELAIRAGEDGEGSVEISVADTGAGLPPEVRSRLFMPFVTTKAHGVGVGLSIAQAIVEAHGGTMAASDNPGGGTVFRFTLRQAGTQG